MKHIPHILFILFILLLSLPAGCRPSVTAPTATVQQAGDLGNGVGAEGRSIANNATGIKSDLKRAGDATPPSAKPAVQPHLDAAAVKADAILVSSQKLDQIAGQIGQLKASIAAEQRQHAEEVKGLNDTIGTLKTDIARKDSDFQHKLNWLSLSAIGLFGVAVVLAFLLHDFTYAVAGGAGCGAVVLACIVTGVAAKVGLWIAGGVAVALAAWVGVTWYRKGSLSAALKTDWQSPIVQQAGAYAAQLVNTLAEQVAPGAFTPVAAAPPKPGKAAP